MRVAGMHDPRRQDRPGGGEAWFDHEWSSEYLGPRATGWDWIGINLDDGGALMAFRIRGAGGETRWAGGRSNAGWPRADAGRGRHTIPPARRWLSPRTGIAVSRRWHVRAGPRTIELGR